MTSSQSGPQWLRLSEAADYVGVHFTTLRRWADDGDVPCIRTPGGRRRFKKEDLDAFLSSHHQNQTSTDLMAHKSGIIENMRHQGIRREAWHGGLGKEQRAMMAAIGRKLTALLIMYVGSDQDDEKVLERGKKLGMQYSEMFLEAGLSLEDIGRAFILVRRSIADALYETGLFSGTQSRESWKNYKRVNVFLDTVLLSILATFSKAISPTTSDTQSS